MEGDSGKTFLMDATKGDNHHIIYRAAEPESFHAEDRWSRKPATGKANSAMWLTVLIKLSPTLLLFALAVLVLAVGFLGSVSSLDQALTSKAFGCDANGNIWVASVHKPSNWDPKYALSITLGFGRLPYTKAKAIDVVWDLIFGRTSQIVAVALIYRVFRRVILNTLERTSAPFDKFVSLQYSTVTLSALVAYAKDVDMWWLWKRLSTRSFLTALALVFTTIYAMILPTWLTTMTGYRAIATPALQNGNGTWISPDDLQTCTYSVADGSRIGLWPNACATVGSSLASALSDYTKVYHVNDMFSDPAEVEIPSVLVLANHSYSLESPLLNITSYGQGSFPLYVSDNHTYDLGALQANGTCQPQSEYQWGFSIFLLFAHLVATNILAILLYSVWLDTFTYHEQQPSTIFGSLTSALEVGAAIHAELGSDADGLRDEDLKCALKLRGAGIRPRKYREVTEEAQGFESSVHVTNLALEDRPPQWAGRET